MIIDCHCHPVDERRYLEYKAKTQADKFMCIRAFSMPTIDEEFYHLVNTIENMYAIEHIDMKYSISEQLNRIENLLQNKKNKIKGIKLYPGYQYFYPNDKKVYEIYNFAQKYDLTVVFHAGDVWDAGNTAMLKYSEPCYIDEIAVLFKDVRFVISHFGFPFFLETARIVHKNENVYTDISGLIEMEYEGYDAMDIIQEYKKDINRVCVYFPGIIDKIMYGTDFCGNETPLSNIDVYIQLVKEVFPNKEIQNKIFGETAKKVYKL